MVEPRLTFIGNGKWGTQNSSCFYFSYGNVLFIFDYHPCHERKFRTRDMMYLIQRSRQIVFIDTMADKEERGRSSSEKDRIELIVAIVGTHMKPSDVVFLYPWNYEEGTGIPPFRIDTNKDPVFIYLKTRLDSKLFDYEMAFLSTMDEYDDTMDTPSKTNYANVIVWIRSMHQHPFLFYTGLQGLAPILQKYNQRFVINVLYLDDYVNLLHIRKDAYYQRLSNTIAEFAGPVYLLGVVPKPFRANILPE